MKNKNNKNKNKSTNNKMQELPNVEDSIKKENTTTEEIPAKIIPTLLKNDNLVKPKLIIPHLVHAKINYLCNKINNIEWSGTLFYTIEGEFNNDLIIKVVDILPQNIGNAAATEIDNDDIDVPCYMVENGLTNCLQGLIHSHHNMATFFSGTDQATLLDEGKDRIHFVSLIINNDNTYSAAVTVKVEVVRIISQIINTTYSYNTFNNKTITGNTEENKSDTENKIQIQYVDLDIEFEESDEVFKLDSIITSLKDKNKAKIPSYIPNYNHNFNNYNNYNNDNLPFYTKNKTVDEKPKALITDTKSIESYLNKYSETDDSPFPDIDTTTEDAIVNKELNNIELGKLVEQEIEADNDDFDITEEIAKLTSEEVDFLDDYVNKAYIILLTGTMYPEQCRNIPKAELIKSAVENQKKYYPDETTFVNFLNGFIEFIIVDALLEDFSCISTTEHFSEDAITDYVILSIIDELEPNSTEGHIQVIIDNLTRFL